jgi:hypothetical protein
VHHSPLHDTGETLQSRGDKCTFASSYFPLSDVTWLSIVDGVNCGFSDLHFVFLDQYIARTHAQTSMIGLATI